jgi:hypothetical protein
MATKTRTNRSSGTSSGDNSSLENAVALAIQNLQSLPINFLAIDFDQTLIDIHTGGVWPGTVDELAPHVRLEFRDLIASALQTGTIHVAIVTFSKQPALIKSVLERALGLEMASKIVIRGHDKSWRYEGAGSQEGKQPHMASAVEELLALHTASCGGGDGNGDNVEITKTTTLLIDDDKRNIRIALDDGVRALWFCPNKPHHLLRDVANLI